MDFDPPSIEDSRDRDVYGHVVGTFRKERDVPMQPEARAALEEQLEEEGELWMQNEARLTCMLEIAGVNHAAERLTSPRLLANR
jgi:hypothetical protein